MEKIRFDVVGLSHWGVRDCWKEYAAKAVGRQLTIQPQSVNLKDPYAVRAREGGLHVGYVAVSDLDVVYQALAGSGEKRLHGVVVESNPEPPVLTVECEVERVDWDYEPFDDKVYEGWKYDGLSLMPKRLELLGDWTTDLMDELESSVANRDAIRKLTGKLLESNLYDMSREMTRARYRIERLLAQCGDKELQEAARKLRQQKGMLMRHESREQIAHYLFIDQPRHLLDKRLEASHYTYDNHLDQLEQQLRAFPYQLYDKFLNDPVDFLREIYYKHVPRKFLFKLLSGIVLMILKGHVEIKKWGREGNTKPIEQIASLVKPARSAVTENGLLSEKAAIYWQRLEQKGFVDKNHKLMPSTTRLQAMYIADRFAEKFGMKARWKPFELLWDIKNLAQEKYAYLEKGLTIPRSKDIEDTFF